MTRFDKVKAIIDAGKTDLHPCNLSNKAPKDNNWIYYLDIAEINVIYNDDVFPGKKIDSILWAFPAKYQMRNCKKYCYHRIAK